MSEIEAAPRTSIEQPYHLILGSASPRRQELLRQLGMDFEVILPEIDEQRQDREAPAAYVRRNSKEKALAVLKTLASHPAEKPVLVISADTVVTIDDQVLEKPESTDIARQMLQSLSGRSHQVITAFCLAARSAVREPLIYNEVVRTKVEFRNLQPSELERYLATGESLDKAGAYGIQGTGGIFVRRIEGSYTNVVGLPMAELCEAIQDFVGKMSTAHNQ